MHPIERLRYIARAGDVDASLIAGEAAEALAGLAREPRALVPSCRRLIEFHPLCGPLWWVCARILVADDIRNAAYEAVQILESDPTPEELAAAFPASATVASTVSPTVLSAFVARPDLSVRLVGSHFALRSGLQQVERDVVGYDPSEIDEACSQATVVVVEALAAGPQGALLDQYAAALVEAGVRSAIPCWIVTGEGRVLPDALFSTIVRRAMSWDEDPLAGDGFSSSRREPVGRRRHVASTAVFVSSDRIDAVIGPFGAARVEDGLGRSTCAAPAELLVLAEGA